MLKPSFLALLTTLARAQDGRLCSRGAAGGGAGKWVDRETAVEDGLVTSRKPDDIPVFCRKTIELFGRAGAI